MHILCFSDSHSHRSTQPHGDASDHSEKDDQEIVERNLSDETNQVHRQVRMDDDTVHRDSAETEQTRLGRGKEKQQKLTELYSASTPCESGDSTAVTRHQKRHSDRASDEETASHKRPCLNGEGDGVTMGDTVTMTELDRCTQGRIYKMKVPPPSTCSLVNSHPLVSSGGTSCSDPSIISVTDRCVCVVTVV